MTAVYCAGIGDCPADVQSGQVDAVRLGCTEARRMHERSAGAARAARRGRRGRRGDVRAGRPYRDTVICGQDAEGRTALHHAAGCGVPGRDKDAAAAVDALVRGYGPH